MATTTRNWTANPNHHANFTEAASRLVRDNVLKVGIVLLGMTVFIAAAEASTPINELNLTDLPSVVTQVANQSANEAAMRVDQPYIVRAFSASDDYAAEVAPNNLVNSPAARFLAEQFN